MSKIPKIHQECEITKESLEDDIKDLKSARTNNKKELKAKQDEIDEL